MPNTRQNSQTADLISRLHTVDYLQRMPASSSNKIGDQFSAFAARKVVPAMDAP
jgi:hypothetical protein